MRPARRWAGVLPAIWVAGLLTTADQGVPPAAKKGVTVSGVVVGPDDDPLQSGAVLMSPAAGDTLALHPAGDVRFLPDGSFSFSHVGPGEYQIRARAQIAGGPPLFAGYRVLVRDRDIADLRLLLRPGATMTGTLEVDAVDANRPALVLTGLRVRAPFVDGGGFGDTLTGSVQRDGRFRLVGVMEGDHFVTVEGLPDPWTVKHARWRNTDVTEIPLSVASGETIQDVRITITTDASEVRGTVRDQAGLPVPDAIVALSPTSYQTWLGASRRFAITRTDGGGRYQYRGLPTGDYRLLASRVLAEADIRASRARELPGVHVRVGAALTEADLVLTAGRAAVPAVR